jgi:hypothetical protein
MEKNLEQKIVELTKQIELQNSIKRSFLISILRGFATALGATVIFGIAIALVFQLVRSIDYVPLLNNILDSAAIEELIHRFTQPV